MSRQITTPEAAMRLARTIASDILLYNRDEVDEGLKNDDLFERLKDQIAEGHRHFNERTSEELRSTHNFLERALVDVLIHRAGETAASCW